MRVSEIIMALALSLVFVGLGWADTQEDWSECSGKDLSIAIQACSRIVSDPATSSSDRVDGYLFRAAAYLAQQTLDQAIADYTEAIRLAPRNITAYAGRSLAYFQKGNRDRAAADFAIANRLDPTKIAELTAANPDMKQIAAFASENLPAPAEASVPVCKPSSLDVGLSKETLDLLETNPLFAEAPPVAVKTFNIDTSSKGEFDGPLGRNAISMVGSNQNTLEVLGGGLVKFENISHNDSKNIMPSKPATTSHSVMRRNGISVGNGLFELFSTMSFQIDGRQYDSPSKPSRVEVKRMSGKMFPVQLNNHFSISISGKDSSTETNCVVSREFDAKSFHPDLNGKAFLGQCESFSVNAVDASKNMTARDKKIFIQEFGYWIQADPVAPAEQIMKRSDTATSGDTTHRMSGRMVLKSFTFGTGRCAAAK